MKTNVLKIKNDMLQRMFGYCFIGMIQFVLLGCSCTSTDQEKGLTTIDLSKDYPKKEILLSEIADIQYVYMNEGNDYIYGGNPLYVSDHTFVFYSEGSFLFFTKDGQPKSKFNHQGNGPDEYDYFSKVVYDEANDELYILSEKRLIVYSSSGVYKRTIALSLSDDKRITSMANYDNGSLLLFDSDNFVLISKADGSELKRLDVSSGEKVKLYAINQDEQRVSVIASTQNQIVNYKDGLLLSDYSTDTVFFFNKNKELIPVLIKQPSIHSMDPVIYANTFVDAADYLFYRKIIVKVQNGQLPSVYLMQNKKDGTVYEQEIKMDDFKGKQVEIAPEILTSSSRHGLVVLDLVELEEAYADGRLKGKLKELMEKIDRENGNNVYMLLTFK
ncbi:6-bladed beta-propeller [Parabacteroides sp. AD58]|uniref:6-bladed beta-propeller n=1 Tax=Parabacteroides absconsus TaxID=2951805 RepID=A0ABZ2IPM3_9BACT